MHFQAQLRLMLRVSNPGQYVLVLEYANEAEEMRNVNLFVGGQTQAPAQARVNIYSCAYRSMSSGACCLNSQLRLYLSICLYMSCVSNIGASLSKGLCILVDTSDDWLSVQ